MTPNMSGIEMETEESVIGVEVDRNPVTAEEEIRVDQRDPPAAETEPTCNEKGYDKEEKTATKRESKVAVSMFGDIKAFRDFFFSAFSDGYNHCCGEDSIFRNETIFSGSSSKVAPDDYTHRSQSTRQSGGIQTSGSFEEAKRQRTRPLAVAVGFNYAADVNGRPIVITKNKNRRSPELTGTRVHARPGATPTSQLTIQKEPQG